MNISKKATLITLVLGMSISLSACTKGCKKEEAGTTETPAEATTGSTENAAPAAEGGLKIEDPTVGTGAEAVEGKAVTVHYTGTLTNGTKFDSSLDRKEPFTFTLGAGQVIKGWEQGIKGMKVGGKRKLTIPADLAYGPNAVGSIPANSTLVFEVELLDVK